MAIVAPLLAKTQAIPLPLICLSGVFEPDSAAVSPFLSFFFSFLSLFAQTTV